MDLDAFFARRKYATSTEATYRVVLGQLNRWLEKQGIPAEQITPEVIRRYFPPAWGDSQRHVVVCAIKAFCRWKFGEDHPVMQLRVRREETQPGRTLTREETDAVFAALSPTRRSDRRSAAMIAVCIDTGLRASEITNLRMSDIDIDNKILTCRRKGGRVMPAVFSDETAKRLRTWQADRERMNGRVKEDWLFVNCRGEKLDRHAFRLCCLRLAKRANVKHFSPHSLRRTFACRAVENGASETLVTAAGGWKSSNMVRLYTRSINLKAMRRFLPMDRQAA